MNKELKESCDLLIQNRFLASRVFGWQYGTMVLLGALFYTFRHQEIRADKLKEAKKILYANSNIFSPLRGNLRLPLICKIALEDCPEIYFQNVLRVQKMLQEYKSRIKDTSYDLIAALCVVDIVGDINLEHYVGRVNDLYARMCREHRFLTKAEDRPFAAMLALTDLDAGSLITEMEACNDYLSAIFRNANARQTLCHVLAIDGRQVPLKCQRISELYLLLSAGKHKPGTGHELAILATLVSLDVSVEQLAEEIGEADDYLKTFRGFGDWLLGAKLRYIFACALVMHSHRESSYILQEVVLCSVLPLVVQAHLVTATV